ncbi:MAG: methyltransferase domain-containing protein [Acidobacteriota bacterium]
MSRRMRALRAVGRRVAPGLRPLSRQLRFHSWLRHARRRYRQTGGADLPLAGRLWVRPEALVGIAGGAAGLQAGEKTSDGNSQVQGGRWDLAMCSLEEMPVFAGIEAHLMHNVSWEKTPLWSGVSDGTPGVPSGEHLRALDEAIADLRACDRSGGNAQRSTAVERLARPITAGIGRHGDLLIHGGIAQACAARVLGLSRVPVTITRRHSNWHRFVAEVWEYARTHDGQVYNVISHPDLANVPATHGHERFKMVRDCLPFASGSVLDVGCHWGYYCTQLERIGFDCVGVEVEPMHAYFLSRLRRSERSRFDIVRKSIFSYRDRNEFDLVLALYIFHHFLKSAATYRHLVEFLGRVRMRALVLGCHNEDQPAMQTAYRNYAPDEMVAFLLEHSSLTRATHVGTEGGRREIFLLQA